MTVAARPIPTGKVRLSRQWFNPLYFILLQIAADPTIRTVAIYGGKSSAKTFSISQFFVRQAFFAGASSIAFRKEGTTIPTTIKQSFSKAVNTMRLGAGWRKLDRELRCMNGAQIFLKGIDDEEKAKGVEGFTYVLLDEANHFFLEEYETFQTSLRGIAGQKIFLTWNPVSEKQWVKTHFVDAYEWAETTTYGTLPSPDSFVQVSTDGTAVLIKTDYRDNYWIAGHPSGTYGFRDDNLIAQYDKLQYTNYNRYRVEVRGEWGQERTGGEFWKQFDETRHVGDVPFRADQPIHVTCDENVNPYVTVGLFQVAGKDIGQVGELPCKSPDNNAPKAAGKLVAWLRKKDFTGGIIYLYGDPSASRRSTVDENNKSFYDKFSQTLTAAGFRVVSRVGKSAPQVALSAAFINDIYEHGYGGYSITIDRSCTTSIDDYSVVQEAPDGSMLKKKVTDPVTKVQYEPNGHFSDAKRYFIVKLLEADWTKYINRAKGVSLDIAASIFG